MASTRTSSPAKHVVRKSAPAKRQTGENRGIGQGSRRQVRVAGALLVGLAATTGLLWLLSPGPLLPDASRRLFAEGTTARALAPDNPAYAGVDPTYRVLFDTRVPVEPGRWRQIVVFPSGTSGGDTGSLNARESSGPVAHFVICNGQGAGDGEVQITTAWDEQTAAGLEGVGGQDAIAICVIGRGGGDGVGMLTASQGARLEGVVAALREGLEIDAQAVRVAARR